MSEHTKGKWEYSVLGGTQTPATLFVNQDGQEIDIAVFEKWEQDWAKEEMIANARLIAAAPKTAQQRDDLLAACKGLVKAKDEMEEDEGYAACECGVMADKLCDYCKAKSAIATGVEK